MEEVGAQAVEEQFAHICDVIGNALADEAAELAAKLLRPTPSICKQAEVEDTEALLICIRLGLTQARHWESTEEAWIYEAPVPVEAVSCSTECEMVKVIEKIADQGHDVQSDFRGGMSGHMCTRCDLFRCQAILPIGPKGLDAHRKHQGWKGQKIA